MRNFSQFLPPLLVAVVFSSCAYDRELLGDPELEEYEPIYVVDEPEPTYVEVADNSAEGSDGSTVEFVPSEENLIVSPVDSLDMFADLRFFGSWYWHDSFGWVWRPTVSHAWAPMTQGYWAWTEEEWMWVSDDPFGSDPYNYGYWAEDVALGWVWVPECTWEPVRCQWIQWDSYVAWAPLLPPGEGDYREPWELEAEDTPWVTVRVANFMKHDVVRYRVTPKFERGVSEETVRRGPLDIERLEAVLGHRIARVPIPWRQPIVVVVPVPVPVPRDGWDPLPPPDPCPPDPWPGPDPFPPSDPGAGASRGDGSKMKGGSTSNPAATKGSPRNFKDTAKDPPNSGGKSKAK